VANELILIVEDNPKNLKLVRDTLQVRFERLTGLADELVVSTSTPLSLPARLRVARSRAQRTPFRS